MQLTELCSLLKQSRSKILVWGDLILDEYQWCTADRVSPEAPVLVCQVNYSTYEAGGAGNVVRNIASLSGGVHFLSRMGKDEPAKILKKVLDHDQIDLAGIYELDQFSSTVKTRVMAHKQQVLRVDKEDCRPPLLDCETFWMTYLDQVLPHSAALVVSDYGKGAIQPGCLQQMIQKAQNCSVPVIVDPKGCDFSKYRGATVITPNMKEFLAVTEGIIQSEADILEQGVALLKKFEISVLVLTRSEKGISVIYDHGKKVDIATKVQDVIDVTGAGDTVVAALARCLAAGVDLETAAHFANLAASVVVKKLGTARCSLDEILANEKS